MLTQLTKGGGGVWEMLTMADEGGRGEVGEMLTMADRGGRGGLDPHIFVNSSLSTLKFSTFLFFFFFLLFTYLLFYCSTVLVFQCSTVLLLYFSTFVLFLFFYFFNFCTFLLFYCSTVLMFNCSTDLWFYFSTVLMFHYSTCILLYLPIIREMLDALGIPIHHSFFSRPVVEASLRDGLIKEETDSYIFKKQYNLYQKASISGP